MLQNASINISEKQYDKVYFNQVLECVIKRSIHFLIIFLFFYGNLVTFISILTPIDFPSYACSKFDRLHHLCFINQLPPHTPTFMFIHSVSHLNFIQRLSTDFLSLSLVSHLHRSNNVIVLILYAVFLQTHTHTKRKIKNEQKPSFRVILFI